MALDQTIPKVLLFPFLAYGHISPFFELARKLSSKNFLVYFCSTPVNLKTIANKLVDTSIRQVEFHLPFPPELPPHYHTTNGLPPHLQSTLLDALNNAGPIFSNILKSIQPDLVIYDVLQTWLRPLSASYDIPAIYFQVFSAAEHSYHLCSLYRPDLAFISTAIFYRQHEINLWKQVSGIDKSNEIVLVRSSRAFEQKYIDFQSFVLDKKMVPLGSLVSDPEDDVNDDSKIIQWLNGKEKASTVYVSFGSEIFLTKEELKEISIGLEISNVNFVWVVRCPNGSKTKLEEVMPEGFLDRIKGKGFVENIWAPQDKILKHPSVGAFVSHCGWGSIMESISFGVPIIAMPVQYDQPLNSRLVVESGVGLEVVGEENGKRKGNEIALVIKKVLVEDVGEVTRRKAKELGKKMKLESEEEGDVAIQELRRICAKKKNHRA